MGQQERDDDLALLRCIAKGGKAGEKALEQLYRTYRPKLLGFLRKRGLELEAAEDVVQHVFVQLVQKAHTFRGDSAVSSWLFQIARNTMVDMFRSTWREMLFDEDGWDALSNTVPAEQNCSTLPDPRKALQDCFNKAYVAFEKAHPAAADLIYRTLQNEHWDTSDIAQYLGRTAGAAREYLSQCRKKLKQFVEPCRHLLDVHP